MLVEPPELPNREVDGAAGVAAAVVVVEEDGVAAEEAKLLNGLKIDDALVVSLVVEAAAAAGGVDSLEAALAVDAAEKENDEVLAPNEKEPGDAVLVAMSEANEDVLAVGGGGCGGGALLDAGACVCPDNDVDEEEDDDEEEEANAPNLKDGAMEASLGCMSVRLLVGDGGTWLLVVVVVAAVVAGKVDVVVVGDWLDWKRLNALADNDEDVVEDESLSTLC